MATPVIEASGAAAAGTAPGSFPVTLPAGTDAVYFFVGTTPAAVITGITYGGTPVPLISAALGLTAEVYRLLMPPTGLNSLVVSGAAGQLAVNYLALSGVDQATPEGTIFSASVPVGGAIGVFPSSVAGDLVVDVAARVRPSPAVPTGIVAAVGQTLIASTLSSGAFPAIIAGSSWKVAVGASTAMNWTGGGMPTAWSMFGFAVKGVAAAPPVFAVGTERVEDGGYRRVRSVTFEGLNLSSGVVLMPAVIGAKLSIRTLFFSTADGQSIRVVDESDNPVFPRIFFDTPGGVWLQEFVAGAFGGELDQGLKVVSSASHLVGGYIEVYVSSPD